MLISGSQMLRSTPIQSKPLVTILVLLIGILAACHITLLLFESTNPGDYHEFRRNKFSFPYLAVCVSIGLMVIEATLLAFVLTRRFACLWLRGLSCLAVLLPCAGYGIM